MSLELHPNDVAAAESLFQTWEFGTDVELEATFKTLDLTKWLQVVQHLRSLGLQEEAQPTKLNIMVAGGLRFTLVDEGIIQQYCEDNVILGKPFRVVLKGKKLASVDGPRTEVDWKEYGTRVKLRRELPLAADDVRVRDVLSRWATIPKSFRLIKRYSFTSLQHKGLVFDLSLVRQSKRTPRGEFLPAVSFSAAEITKQPIVYEAEVEAIQGATFKSLLVGIGTVLRGIQNSFVLTRDVTKRNVLEFVAAQTGAAFGAFPGPQPATLERNNILPGNTDVPNIRTGDYNVTDKADGQRCLLVVMKTGTVYLVDTNMTVYGTDLRLGKEAAAAWAGMILDGEWVRHDANNAPVSRYYAFDIYNGAGGADVTRLPFIVRGNAATGAVNGEKPSRFAALEAATGILANAERVISRIPKSESLSVHMKSFHTAIDPTDSMGIFREAAGILDRLAADPPYHSDGLIFTPNAAGLPKNSGTWSAQLKWKPAAENTIDFMVMVERGQEEGSGEAVGVKVNEETNEIVRYKTLRLFVGSNTDPALANARDTILNRKDLPASLEEGEYRPVEFSPQPADPMASVCYIALNAGATDVAGATAAAKDLAAMNETMRCTRTGDPITARSIVEMAYHPEKPAGWRWEPIRVRWDKTERFQRGQMGRTMNADWVANSIWSSIHNPVTEHMIRTGALEEGEEATAVKAAAYYQRKAPARDLHRIRGLREFHNRYVKEEILLGHTLGAGRALYDMTCGQAGDIHKWIRGKVEWVLGTDLAEKNLTDSRDGAYRRYLDQTVRLNGKLPPMLFIQADASQRLSDGGAGQSPMDRAMLRLLWGSGTTEEAEAPPYAQLFKGKAKDGFDVVACMFSLHYFFKDRPTVDGWLRNVSETLRVGGMLVGCCFDGDLVASMLGGLAFGEVKRGVEGGVEVWSITKQYEDDILPATDAGLGKAIAVNFISIGESYTEYLVSWAYLKGRLEAIGVELLNAEELGEMGLQHSTSTFGESYEMAAKGGRAFPMSPTLKQFSFLNRWFIMKRRSTGAEIPYTAPGVLSAQTAEEREEAMGPVGPTGDAPVSEEIREDDALPDIVGPMLEVEEVPAELEEVFEARANEAEEVDMEEIEEEKPKPAKAKTAKATKAKSPKKANKVVEEVEKEEYEEEEEEEEKPKLPTKVKGPIFKVWQKGELKDDLELGDKGWRRWLGTYAQHPIQDWKDASIVYPSLEAAFASAKYQIASNKPELGPKLFGMDGEIHQKYALQRAEMKKIAEGKEWSLQEDEGDEVRKMTRGTEMKKVGAKLDTKKWESGLAEVIQAYVKQRYASDARFKKAVDAVKAVGGQVMFYTTPKGNEFSGYEEDGVIKGDNLYGKAIMEV